MRFCNYILIDRYLDRRTKVVLKEEVLYALEQQKGEIVAGGSLAKTLGVSRTSVWKAIHSLQEEGNEIETVPNTGYRLLPTNDTLSKRIIIDRLSTRFIGREMAILPFVNSTNQYLKEANKDELQSGHVVIADEQMSGRGRRGRTFVSAKGEGVYLSILLKLNGQNHDLRLLTVCAAVAVSKAIENICDIDAKIKWVNDIFLNNKKVCGILTEATLSAELQELDTIILGIGINTGDIATEIQDIATSLQRETGMRGIRNSLVAEVLNQFEAIYLDYTERGNKEEILKSYEDRLFIKGQQIFVVNSKEDYPVIVQGIDDTGGLIVQTSAGDVEHITSGEIRLS